MQAMKWIIKRVKIFTFSITSWNKILFDGSRKQLVTIEFGGNTVVKTRNPLCRGRASPFPGGTLPLFDPVPAACPLLVAPFPCCACLPSCVHTCVRACVRACRFPLFTQCLLDRVCVCLSISLFARHSSFLLFFLHWLVAFLRGERELAGRATASSKVTSNELILARGSLDKFYVPSRAPLLSQFYNSCPLVPARWKKPSITSVVEDDRRMKIIFPSADVKMMPRYS